MIWKKHCVIKVCKQLSHFIGDDADDILALHHAALKI